VEDWEEEARKKNDCVPEALLLQKYKVLVFHDPNSGNDFCIWQQNMEFHRGRGNGWFLLGVCAEDGVEDEAFTLELPFEMMGKHSRKMVFRWCIESLIKRKNTRELSLD
jgi:hypothetical protein